MKNINSVIHGVAVLVATVAVLWPALAIGANALGMRDSWFVTAIAAIVCLIPAAATLAAALWPGKRSPQWEMLAILGGMAARLLAVTGGGLVVFLTVNRLRNLLFVASVLVYYLATLAVETRLVVKSRRAQPPSDR